MFHSRRYHYRRRFRHHHCRVTPPIFLLSVGCHPSRRRRHRHHHRHHHFLFLYPRLLRIDSPVALQPRRYLLGIWFICFYYRFHFVELDDHK